MKEVETLGSYIRLKDGTKGDLQFDREYLNELGSQTGDILVKNKPQIKEENVVFDEVSYTDTLDVWVKLDHKGDIFNGLGSVTGDDVIKIVGEMNHTVFLTREIIEQTTFRKISFQKKLLEALWDAYKDAVRDKERFSK